MQRLFPLLLAASLLLAGHALANPQQRLDESVDTGMRTVSRIVGDGESREPTPLQPVLGVHAAAFPWPGVGVFAQSLGFAAGRREAVYDFEGGASWLLRDGVQLRASYRLLGVDFGFDSDIERPDREPGISAPFLGLAIDF